MFKNRAIQLKMVKTNKDDIAVDETARFDLDYDKINTLAKEQVKNVAIAVGAVFVVVKVANTLSEIAINYAPKN